MAQLYYRMGIHDKPAQFDHFFRSYPDYGSHRSGYCINAGIRAALIGGVDFSSAVGISHVLGFPPKGTHAHSMVEAFTGLDSIKLHHPTEKDIFRVLKRDQISRIELLHENIMKEGVRTGHSPSIDEMRAVRNEDIKSLENGIRLLVDPQVYHVSLSDKLWNIKNKMTEKIRF